MKSINFLIVEIILLSNIFFIFVNSENNLKKNICQDFNNVKTNEEYNELFEFCFFDQESDFIESNLERILTSSKMFEGIHYNFEIYNSWKLIHEKNTKVQKFYVKQEEISFHNNELQYGFITKEAKFKFEENYYITEFQIKKLMNLFKDYANFEVNPLMLKMSLKVQSKKFFEFNFLPNNYGIYISIIEK
jgi:hypothetical protein